MMKIVSHCSRLIKRWWRLLFIFIIPLLLLPLPLIVRTIQARCAYIVIILTAYWVSEAVPYAVTSLLPLAFFPMAGIISGDSVGLNYFKDITTMFVGSMILAHAMEHVGLHRRLALLVLRYVGTSIRWSMGGLMLVTAFLSMWINNSAAANVMIPTAIAIVSELQSHKEEKIRITDTTENDNHPESVDVLRSTPTDIPTSSKEQSLVVLQNIIIASNRRMTEDELSSRESRYSSSTALNTVSTNKTDSEELKTGFLIAVAFSSAIGGMITLVGTGPNIFVKGFADQYYSNGNIKLEISFANFILYGFPIGVILLVLCWVWLQILYNRKSFIRYKRANANEVEFRTELKSLLKQQYKELGPISWQEGTIAVLFVLVVLLWVTRDFSSFRGWDIFFRKNYVTDGTTAILIGSLPLILPNKNPFTHNWEYHSIVEWNQLSKAFPWGVFMLQGAGLAIANGFQTSNLSSTIASFLHFIIGAPQMAIILVVIIISALFTEFTSNLACASILFPILDSVAKTASIHPARLILPSCMAVSLSFMLPIATPPNAMIFVNGNMKTRDLIKAGLGMKILGIIVIFFVSILLVAPIFHIQDVISVANSTLMGNATSG